MRASLYRDQIAAGWCAHAEAQSPPVLYDIPHPCSHISVRRKWECEDMGGPFKDITQTDTLTHSAWSRDLILQQRKLGNVVLYFL